MEFRRVLFRSHACHLRLAVGQGQQTAGDVDIAARQGEGVDDVAVQDREGEGYPRLARLVGQAPPDAVDIGCQPGVVVDPAEGLDDLRILLCPDLRFLGLGDEEEMPRSEEHTSELQSLMRISYAVFSLKKNKHIDSYTHVIVHSF